MTEVLRVGIIGATAQSGWARESHVPAIQGLQGLMLSAVAARRQETADEAAHAFGVPKAYAGGRALIADPDIDLVTIATQVPDHRDLVLAALAAGKHVYCEWPLGRGVDESSQLARAARGAGTHSAIGLQLRGSPAVRAARQMLASGAVGRLLALSTFSSTAGFGADIPAPYVYLEDPANFANLVTIQGAHTLDLVLALGGDLKSMMAQASRQFPQTRIGPDRSPRARETFDHLAVNGRFAAGAPFVIEVAGGRTNDTPFHLDLFGEAGHLRLDGGAARGLQSGRIGLVHNGVRQQVDEGELAGLAESALNVAGVYAALRDDIFGNSRKAADFNHAVRLTHLIEGLLTASEHGGGAIRSASLAADAA